MSEQNEQEQDQGIEREGSAPVQQADAVPQYVDLVGLLMDEFGISMQQASREIKMGDVLVDGEPPDAVLGVKRNITRLPRESVEGRTIEVHGGETNRIYRFQIQ